MPNPYRWLPGAARYYDMGAHRFVARSTVKGFVEASLKQSSNVVGALTEYHFAGTLSAADWHNMVREELKREHIRQYVLGIGGRDQMTPADWGRVGAMLKEQYKYLRGFRDELAAGNVAAGQAQVRAGMYVNAAREAFERAKLQAHNRSAEPPDEEAWYLGPAEHCPDCLDYAAMGWQPVGTFPFPGDGSTICLTNCKCSKDYRRAPRPAASEEQ